MGSERNIIGIVGPLACGKGVVADYLIKKYGYISYSLSSVVHEEVKRRGITTFTRTTLQDIGNELRAREGDDVLARRIVMKLKTLGPTRDKIIIEGIRNTGEVRYLRTIPGFYLIGVDAAKEIRYKRALKRAKPWDPTDWETFVKVDGRDRGDGESSSGQQVRRCMEMADVKIDNNDGETRVHRMVDSIMMSLRSSR